MFSRNDFLSKLSIRILVVMLAVFGTIASLVLGSTAMLAGFSMAENQTNLINLSAIQESSARVSESLINFQTRQAAILAARSQESIEALSDKSALISKYENAVAKLTELTEHDENLVKLITVLNGKFKSFMVADESIYKASNDLIMHKNSVSDLAQKIDQQLETLDSQIGNIAGKLSFAEKKNKRKIKRVLKKTDVDDQYFEYDIIRKLIANVKTSVLGKQASHLESINNLKSDYLNLAAYARQLLSSDDIDTVLSLRKNKISQRLDSINSLVSELKESFATNQELASTVGELATTLDNFVQAAFLSDNSIYNLQISIIDTSHEQENLQQQAAGETTSLNNTVDNILQIILAGRKQISSHSIELVDTNRWVILSITSGIIVFLITISTFVVMSINKPLANISSAFRKIAQGDGDLTQRLDTRGLKEIVDISSEFNRFVEKMAFAIEKVDEACGNLFVSSNTLKNVSDQTRANIERQQHETGQTATAMLEMTESAKSIADNAEKAKLSSHEVRNESAASSQIVEEVASTIQNLEKGISDTSGSIKNLEKFSVSIGRVLDVIRSIAEQTNLLALNAAIEAARAGEQGRGFAVVADEVRSLANRTQDSTVEIEEMVKLLQDSAQKAVVQIEEGNSDAQKAVVKARNASSSLARITEAITEISTMNTEIAKAAGNQSTLSLEINSSVDEIRMAGDKNVQGTNEIAQSGADLSNLSTELQHLMTQFKF